MQISNPKITTCATHFLLFALAGSMAAQGMVRLAVERDADGFPVPCAEDPVCHNRIHPDIPPVATAAPGETIVFETRDAFDGQLGPDSEPADVAAGDPFRVHPLTGPVFVEGAGPGDVLEVRILNVQPGPEGFGVTTIFPGFGFLRDLYFEPDLLRWELASESAVSEDLAGVTIPAGGHPGVVTVAPDRTLLDEILARELDALLNGGFVGPPAPTSAVPASLCGEGAAAEAECLRTLPPREHGGNLDVKGMVRGTRILLPCYVDGCHLSIGDVHFAQGDGESVGTAIEMPAVVKVKVDVRHAEAELLGKRPAFEGKTQLRQLAPMEFYSTVGLPLKAEGELAPHQSGLFGAFAPPTWIDQEVLAARTNVPEDSTLAARDALRRMIDWLVATRGMSEHQAYMLTGVAVNLRIGNLVDVPNPAVYAVLPLEIFDDH